MSAKKADTFQFETALGKLNKIVERMEQGDLPLEEALKQFENGISLTRQCQKAIEAAEQKVSVLMKKNGQESLEPYPPEE